ncbi:S1C family serine protease [Slackia heliotrinireducens]|uniref:S1C family serine protease n=1 Tax=Slackia heliotrinireducens TaxID=84110 RepID=UPI003314DD0D
MSDELNDKSTQKDASGVDITQGVVYGGLDEQSAAAAFDMPANAAMGRSTEEMPTQYPTVAATDSMPATYQVAAPASPGTTQRYASTAQFQAAPQQPAAGYQIYQQTYAQQQAFAQQQAYAQQQAQQAQQAAQAKQAEKNASGQKSGAGKTFAAGFAGAALACALGLGGFVGYGALTSNNGSQGDVAETPALTQPQTKESSSTTINVNGEDTTLAQAVAAKALPSIASIDVYTKSGGSSWGWGMEADSSDSNSALSLYSLGSGVVITEDGYIITNYHVVEGADALTATINGVEYDAEYVGADPTSDIAVIKVNATDLTAIEIGSSSDVQVGEWVMSLGNAFGLDNSVSTGIVSALQRSTTLADETTGEVMIYPNMIQTDATINPGNSGGALVNANGELIGINSMITSYSGSSSGVGFAIPIDYAMGLAEQIIAGQTPTHAQLGVSMSAINAEVAQYNNLPTDKGVYVAAVYSGTAADEAGLETGDIIVKFDGQSITAPEELQLAVRGCAVGDTVDVVVNRGGEEITISVTLGSDETALSQEGAPQNNGNGYGNNDGGNEYGYGYNEQDLYDLFEYFNR